MKTEEMLKEPLPEGDEKQQSQESDLGRLESELERERYRSRFRSTLQNTIFVLITVAAAAVLVATLWMPVLQIYGSSMAPSLGSGDVVVCRKAEHFSKGDVIAFYYNNKILIKRVIALGGDQISISDDGKVTLNGEPLEEPYVEKLSMGQCNISFPYTVPAGKVFVMGDEREGSVDSRNSNVGCVDPTQVVGKLLVRVWPTTSISLVK